MLTTTKENEESSTFSLMFSPTMNTTDITTLENRTSSYSTESNTTTAAVVRQSTSFLIPISILFSVGLFVIVGVICFYARKWQRQHRRKPLPLPHPYPENEMVVRYQSANMEEHDHFYDDSQNLISPSSNETEFPEQSLFHKTMAEPLYANESTPAGRRTSPIYENYDSSYYMNTVCLPPTSSA